MVEDLRQVVESNTTRVDALNETQSLSSTMVLPPAFVPLVPPAPAAPAARGSFLDRLRGRSAAPPAPSPPPSAEPAADGTGTGTGGTGTGTGSSAVTPVRCWPPPRGRPTLSRTRWRPRRRS